ncbi:MAG: hypothetical protein ACLVI5_08280, partial [Desulfovibrio piger]|uniref:hypothetical protein n=1 Tax=Desulfovibrio piger TaxID=901 RepID=UPI00399C41A2
MTDTSENAVASGIKAETSATYSVPSTITRAEATAIGKQSALSLGVFAQSSSGNRLTVNLAPLDISSTAVTENGTSRSVGIYSDVNSSVSAHGGTIVSSAHSKNGIGEAFGAMSQNNSSVTLGADTIVASSESSKHLSDPRSVGIYFSDNSTFNVTSNRIRVDVSATHNGDVFSRKVNGIYGDKNSTLTMNDADISVREINSTPDKSGAAGIHLLTASTLAMKDASIRVAAVDHEGTFAGSAVGIVTSPTSGRQDITAGTLDIRAQGGWASGIQLENTDMRMAGGTVMSSGLGRSAYGIRTTHANFTATGDIDVTTHADRSNSTVGGILAVGKSSITMRGGSVTASSNGDGGAIGLYAKDGGSITKTGGDITVVSTAIASGMDAFPTSKITYGDAKATTRISVEGRNAYGVRARGQAGSDQAASIELTNGVIEARSHGDTAIAAYSASGDIGLKGTTAITATAAAPGK